MKKLPLKSTKHLLLLKGFKQWLTTLGYSKSAIEYYPNHLQELLHYLEQKAIYRPQQIHPQHLTQFIEQVKHRSNQTLGGGLSTNTINYIIRAIKKYQEYLRTTQNIQIEAELTLLKPDTQQKDILSKAEIKTLFQRLEASPHPLHTQWLAILAVLYGTGLRKSEIQHLELEDISFKNSSIHVKSGKGNKDRIVPITQTMLKHIQTYIRECRDHFESMVEECSSKLFISVLGKPLTEDAYYNTLKQIINYTQIETLQEKHITLHTFRHSVATHLLQNGMQIESLQRFLGHSSLDSTMIYLHAAKELKNDQI